jgi:hypothetical protein
MTTFDFDAAFKWAHVLCAFCDPITTPVELFTLRHPTITAWVSVGIAVGWPYTQTPTGRVRLKQIRAWAAPIIGRARRTR